MTFVTLFCHTIKLSRYYIFSLYISIEKSSKVSQNALKASSSAGFANFKSVTKVSQCDRKVSHFFKKLYKDQK